MRSTIGITLRALVILAPAGAAAQTVIESKTPLRDRDVIFVPTREAVATAMMKLAGVTSNDVVYDLGSGDGRLVIAAAKRGARGVGIDIDPQRIEESRAAAKAAGVEHLVEFRLQDALEADVSGATVVTLYLLSSSNRKLRPRLTEQLKPGSRIVSHQFGMGDWEPEKVDTFTDGNGTSRTLYLWTVGR